MKNDEKMKEKIPHKLSHTYY